MNTKIKPSAQDIQDEIFRKMSADRKLEIAAGMWRLGRELDKDKITYDPRNHRSPDSTRQSRADS